MHKIFILTGNTTAIEEYIGTKNGKYYFLYPESNYKVPTREENFSIADQIISQYKLLNINIYVATHSMYLLNKFRIRVKQKVISHNAIEILYFSQNDYHLSIKIHEDGGIHDWPEGFFDELDKDFSDLFGE